MNANNLKFNIATASSRLAKQWRNRAVTWDELATRLSNTTYTSETVAEYRAASRERQSQIKDVGGFVGGYLRDGVRRNDNVTARSIVTLDADTAQPDIWATFTAKFGCAAVMYSTHKHTPEKWRVRLVMPLSREVTPEEYEPVCRYICEHVGLAQFDSTTCQASRLMYWPSTSADGCFLYQRQNGEPLDPDTILATYRDWRDASTWPMFAQETPDALRREYRSALDDPSEKQGLIGAFCEAYDVNAAIETFLRDCYDPAGHGRYTWSGGSVSAGLVVYGDGAFAYSNHDTDPAGHKVCNAFDLVRIHKFGSADMGRSADDVTKLPSYKAMMEFAAADPKVKRLIVDRRAREFDGAATAQADDGGDGTEDPDEWKDRLDIDKRGDIKPRIGNVNLILTNDPKLKGQFWANTFAGEIEIGKLPWPRASQSGFWSNGDDSELRLYLESHYNLCNANKIICDAFNCAVNRDKRNPVRQYLEDLPPWDGTPRLETMLSDYLGADMAGDRGYLTREMTRKHFVAAVARVFEPGIKYDYCLTLTGVEGAGKSQLIKVMGVQPGWSTDSLSSIEGKEGSESVRGVWLIEIGELASFNRSSIETVKNFLSRSDDHFRPAYERHSEYFPRQCVFFATTNEEYFLKGENGNRRFWVVPINKDKRKYVNESGGFDHERLKANRNQIWAEAIHYYRAGETLYFAEDVERIAKEIQRAFNDNADDEMRVLLDQFIETKLPVDWELRSVAEHRAWYANSDGLSAAGRLVRTEFCIAEFLVEFVGLDRTHRDFKYASRKIGAYMKEKSEWEVVGTKRTKWYSVQKTYRLRNKPETRNWP